MRRLRGRMPKVAGVIVTLLHYRYPIILNGLSPHSSLSKVSSYVVYLYGRGGEECAFQRGDYLAFFVDTPNTPLNATPAIYVITQFV
ncbi:unnamed protein product [Pieris macdunnoughi]|uniref:Uncharacterized protein n=1 Tax=Pieris macdunnoughi TaxID=345717 RepID=A0A821MRT1_9NEOP|nr:unnamed protein product [Pieris macdunnoughi]